MSHSTRQILAAIACSASMVSGIFAASAAVQPALAGPTPEVVAYGSASCYEDEPCFRWSTMGNLARGIVTTGGRRLVVEPCRFAYLDHTGRIDWKRTPRLRGDAYARANGCNPRLYA